MSENLLDTLSEDEQQALVDLARASQSDKLSRRDAMKALGMLGLGGLVGTGGARVVQESVDPAAAQASGTVGTAGSPVDVFAESVDADSATINGGGSINGRVPVRTESQLDTVISNSSQGFIPRGETVEITSTKDLLSGLELDIYGTLKQADGADITDIFTIQEEQNIRIGVHGTVDGNQANQTNSRTAFALLAGYGTYTENVHIHGQGTLTNFEGARVVEFLRTVRASGVSGITVENYYPRATEHSFFASTEGAGDEPTAYIENIHARGSTWGGNSGDGEFARLDTLSQISVRFCDLIDIPERPIFGGSYVVGNYIENPAQEGSSGGDGIANAEVIAYNVIIGSFDDNGDNGITVRRASTIVGNYIEGMSNNGILVLDPAGNTQLFTVAHNVCVDCDQRSTGDGSGVEVRATNATGKFLVKGNVAWGDSSTPTYGIRVESSALNGRVTENMAHGNGTNVSDSSDASTTVTDNIS